MRDQMDELESLVRSIEHTLVEEGYMAFVDTLAYQDRQGKGGQRPPPQPGIRIRGKLSFRGRDMAAEYFDYLDEDGDGYLTFSDFRGEGCCPQLLVAFACGSF